VAEAIAFEVVLPTGTEDAVALKIEMKDAPYREVEISKTDITTGKELPGATADRYHQGRKEVDQWTSRPAAHTEAGCRDVVT